MTASITFNIAQINPIVGDLQANQGLIAAAFDTGREAGADLVITPELAISGYPPEDLVLKASFQEACRETVMALAEKTKDGAPGLVVSAPWVIDGVLYNAALLLDGGKVEAVVPKVRLPNFGVFDEMRLFEPGPNPEPVLFRGTKLGIMTCEDMWTPEVTQNLTKSGAETLVVLNASPFEMDKPGERLGLARMRVKESGLALVYANMVGGQDELVFDGASFVLDAAGETVTRLKAFETDSASVRFTRDGVRLNPEAGKLAPEPGENEAIYRALVLGLHDYVDKNFFPGVMIGLSGGVDSALTAAIAVDALGADRVHCVMMPSPYTSAESLDDATESANLLGVKLDNIAIKQAMESFDDMLKEVFVSHEKDTTEENIQARARGIVLMAISNKLGYMVVSTGNKSEMSVGYATLYGDMCGGYSVLKDVYKTRVWRLCRWRNESKADGLMGPDGRVVPERTITKAPTAELKPNQTDQDNLPPYEALDDILHGLVELELSTAEIVALGHAEETVHKVWRMLDRAEYKRRQAPPGVKITSRAFGRDRRYPITNGFRA